MKDEKIRFKSPREEKDDINLVGNYWEADSDAGIVMSHGFTGDKTEWGYFDQIAEELNDAGYNVLTFDFAGSGESDDEPLRIDRQVDDLSAAIDYLEGRGIERIGLYGHSQGGLVSLRNYSDRIDTMVLTSPVTDSMPDYRQFRLEADERDELNEKGYFVKYREKGPRDRVVVDEEIIEQKESVNQDELLSGITCPVLIIHGDKDDVVDLESSEKAASELENSELRAINDLTHSYDNQLDKVAENAVDWFGEHL